MKTTKTITSLTCDFCGEEMVDFDAEQNRNTKICILEYEKWYQGRKKAVDICVKCNDKLVNFLIENNMYIR